MPIPLNDAIERLKASLDDHGMFSQETFNRINEKLDDKDKSAFLMTIVDLGYHPRLANSVSKHTQKKIKAFLKETKEEPKNMSVAEKFLKAAQVYEQSDSGLYTPSQFVEEKREDIPQEVTHESETVKQAPVEPIDDTMTAEPIVYSDILDEAGLDVSTDGMVTFHTSNIPGLFISQVPTKPMTLEQTIQYVNQQVFAAQNAYYGSQDFLDNLVRTKSEVQDITDLVAFLETGKFSPRSKDPLVSSIGQNLQALISTLKNNTYEIEQALPLVDELVNAFEQYNVSQDESSNKKIELLETLEDLAGFQQSDPELFLEAIGKGKRAVARKMIRGLKRMAYRVAQEGLSFEEYV